MSNTARHDGIVVLGSPRSGTTLLRRLLDSHPNIAAPGETHLLTACAQFLRSERSAGGVDVGVLTGLGFAGFESADVVDRLREFAFAFRREHAKREGKTRWAEKTAVDAFHVAEISRLCGDQAYFVCVTRHGLDVACSMREWCRKSETYFHELQPYIRNHPRPLEAFCHAWVDATTMVNDFAASHPANAISVRYEDLVADPNREMRRVIEFVGESWDDELVMRALAERRPQGFSDWKTFSRDAIDNSSIDRWKRLSTATISDLARIANSTLEACGYDAVEIETSDSADAARRYELGLIIQRMKRKSSEEERTD